MAAPDEGIGLDLATHITGVFEARGEKFLGGRLIKVKKQNNQDWLEMASQVADFLDAAQPDFVSIEDVYLGPNVRTTKLLSMLSGAVRFWCYRKGIPFYVATTREIDAACDIPSKPRKAAIRKFASTLGFELPQDSADALAVLFWGMGQRRQEKILEQADGEMSEL